MWTRSSIDGEGVVVPGADAAGDPTCDEHQGFGQCTRSPGHAGRHMASVGSDRIISAWPGDMPPTVADLDGVPAAAIQAVAEQLMNDYEQEYTLAPGATWREFEPLARRLLDVAAQFWTRA